MGVACSTSGEGDNYMYRILFGISGKAEVTDRRRWETINNDINVNETEYKIADWMQLDQDTY